MKLVLIGPTNSGKGTLAENLKRVIPGIAYLSTGSIFRRLIKEGDEVAVGLERDYFSRGKNAPDEITLSLLEKELKKLNNPTNAIIDGYPRNVSQARTLDGLFPGIVPLYLEVSEETLLRRAGDRAVCSDESCGRVYNYLSNPPKERESCNDCSSPLVRRDDNPELLVKRIKDFRVAFTEISTYYGDRLKKINGENRPALVLLEALDLLKDLSVTLKNPPSSS